jgi:hypothetical protein
MRRLRIESLLSALRLLRPSSRAFVKLASALRFCFAPLSTRPFFVVLLYITTRPNLLNRSFQGVPMQSECGP